MQTMIETDRGLVSAWRQDGASGSDELPQHASSVMKMKLVSRRLGKSHADAERNPRKRKSAVQKWRSIRLAKISVPCVCSRLADHLQLGSELSLSLIKSMSYHPKKMSPIPPTKCRLLRPYVLWKMVMARGQNFTSIRFQIVIGPWLEWLHLKVRCFSRSSILFHWPRLLTLIVMDRLCSAWIKPLRTDHRWSRRRSRKLQQRISKCGSRSWFGPNRSPYATGSERVRRYSCRALSARSNLHFLYNTLIRLSGWRFSYSARGRHH